MGRTEQGPWSSNVKLNPFLFLAIKCGLSDQSKLPGIFIQNERDGKRHLVIYSIRFCRDNLSAKRDQMPVSKIVLLMLILWVSRTCSEQTAQDLASSGVPCPHFLPMLAFPWPPSWIEAFWSPFIYIHLFSSPAETCHQFFSHP